MVRIRRASRPYDSVAGFGVVPDFLHLPKLGHHAALVVGGQHEPLDGVIRYVCRGQPAEAGDNVSGIGCAG